MKYEDLSFTVINDEGQEVICDVLSVIPNETEVDSPYIVFTDYMLDENDEFIFQYGKVIEVEGEYVLKRVEDEKTIQLIKEGLKDDIVSYVNEQIQNNIHE